MAGRDLRASLATNGLPPEVEEKMLSLHDRNIQLTAEMQSLEQKLHKAKAVSLQNTLTSS